MGTHPIFESDFDCLTEIIMTSHTARRRKREERRKKLGLPRRPNIEHQDSQEKPDEKTDKSKYKDEQINLSHSEVKNVTFLTLLAADKAFSASMATVGASSKFLNFLFQSCEFVGNGVLWLVLASYALWSSKLEKYYVISFNFMYGLLLDIIIVGIIKNLTKRERPGKNTVQGLDWGPDRYSFPSGHASRAVFVAIFLIDQFRISGFYRIFICANVFWFVLTRVWMGRHHLFDVIAGSFNGFIVYKILLFLWLDTHQTRSISYFGKYVLHLFGFKS